MNRENRNARAWAATLGAGLVVEVAVWGLLEWLRRTVDDVEEGIDVEDVLDVEAGVDVEEVFAAT